VWKFSPNSVSVECRLALVCFFGAGSSFGGIRGGTSCAQCDKEYKDQQCTLQHILLWKVQGEVAKDGDKKVQIQNYT
jgi:hypothetical protein